MHAMNIQTIKTCMTNVQMVHTHVRLIQTINPTSVQATPTCMMTKLPKKQYETHNNKIKWGNCSHDNPWQDYSLILPVPAYLTRSINVGPPSSRSTLVVLTHIVLDPSMQEIE